MTNRTRRRNASSRRRSPNMKTAHAEKPDQADDDQINRDDEVQQTRHEQNENARDERHQRCKAYMNIHGQFLVLAFASHRGRGPYASKRKCVGREMEWL